MIESPSPTHGFLSVQVACVVYAVLVFGTTIGLHALGFPSRMAGLALLVVAAVLLVPFVPLFRRLAPEHDRG